MELDTFTDPQRSASKVRQSEDGSPPPLVKSRSRQFGGILDNLSPGMEPLQRLKFL